MILNDVMLVSALSIVLCFSRLSFIGSVTELFWTPIHDVLAQSTVFLAERHVLWPGHLGAANPRQGPGHQCEEFRDLESGTNDERIDRLMQRGVVSDIRERHGRTIGRTDVTIVCRAVN